MPTSALIIRDGDAHHRLLADDRDIGLLWGPLFLQGAVFSLTFGFYENFTVARGIPKGSHVIRPGRNLFNATHGLQTAVERDADLLKYDYTFSFGDERTEKKGPVSVIIRGRSGIVQTFPSGYCFSTLKEPGPKGGRIAEVIDLRVVEDCTAEGLGAIKIHRKGAKLSWIETLPPLLEFLKPRVRKRLIVEHIDRAG
jgi:hypothetical protein